VDVRAMQVETAIRCMREPRSLDAPLLRDFEASLGDLLHDVHAVSPYEAAVHASLVDWSERMLSCLPPREATVLRLPFDLGGEHEHTLEEIGTRFLLTRERIRQIEAKALGKLRKRSPELAALLDGRELAPRTLTR
jgi:RNA polymerase primary sigma factor